MSRSDNIESADDFRTADAHTRTHTPTSPPIKSPTTSAQQRTTSPCSSCSEESILAMSESQFFPTPSDSIWQSAAVMQHSQGADSTDVLAPKEGHESPEMMPSSSWHGRCPEEDDGDKHRTTGTQGSAPGTEQQDKCTLAQESVSSNRSEPLQNQAAKAASSEPNSLAGLNNLMESEHIGGMRLPTIMHPPSIPGVEASAEEVEEKLVSGLRFLDDLAHSSADRGGDLKTIYDAYYNFTRTLFENIKLPNKSKNSPDCAEIDWQLLERQKTEICEQEALLKKEMLHYKATKRELQKVADDIEVASRSYRKPDVLEDVILPRDVKLSSSAEYVAEIEELQELILRKQERVKGVYKDIQEHYLPKDLVDSMCESHRLAVQNLRDIKDETIYLRECVIRLDHRYLYNMQIT